jgi:hypothetical protein
MLEVRAPYRSMRASSSGLSLRSRACVDARHLEAPDFRVVKGGAWTRAVANGLVAVRFGAGSEQHTHSIAAILNYSSGDVIWNPGTQLDPRGEAATLVNNWLSYAAVTGSGEALQSVYGSRTSIPRMTRSLWRRLAGRS